MTTKVLLYSESIHEIYSQFRDINKTVFFSIYQYDFVNYFAKTYKNFFSTNDSATDLKYSIKLLATLFESLTDLLLMFREHLKYFCYCYLLILI